MCPEQEFVIYVSIISVTVQGGGMLYSYSGDGGDGSGCDSSSWMFVFSSSGTLFTIFWEVNE